MSFDLKYDVFLSYSTRLHEAHAKAAFEELTSVGYKVWFDQSIIGKKIAYRMPDYVETAARLEDGIRNSRVTALFAMEAELNWPNYPCAEISDAAIREVLRRGTNRPGQAFSWQTLERSMSQNVIVVHKNAVVVEGHSGGRNYQSISAAVRTFASPSSTGSAPSENRPSLWRRIFSGKAGRSAIDRGYLVLDNTCPKVELHEPALHRSISIHLNRLYGKGGDSYGSNIFGVVGPPGTGKKSSLTHTLTVLLHTGCVSHALIVEDVPPNDPDQFVRNVWADALSREKPIIVFLDFDQHLLPKFIIKSQLGYLLKEIIRSGVSCAFTSDTEFDASELDRKLFVDLHRTESLGLEKLELVPYHSALGTPTLEEKSELIKVFPSRIREQLARAVRNFPIYAEGRPNPDDLSGTRLYNMDAYWALAKDFSQYQLPPDIDHPLDQFAHFMASRYELPNHTIRLLLDPIPLVSAEWRRETIKVLASEITQQFQVLESADDIRLQLGSRFAMMAPGADQVPILQLHHKRADAEGSREMCRYLAAFFYGTEATAHFDATIAYVDNFEGPNSLFGFMQRTIERWPYWVVSLNDAGIEHMGITPRLERLTRRDQLGFDLNSDQTPNPWRQAIVVHLV